MNYIDNSPKVYVYADSPYKIWVGTQTAYDALGTYSTTTIYIIVG